MRYVLVTQREQKDRYGERIDVLEASYMDFFHELGFFPVAMSNSCMDAVSLFTTLDPAAVILTGGGDVPVEYCWQAGTGFQQENRDRLEHKLTGIAIEKGLPLLGICRGMQFLNGYFGGKVSRLDFPPGCRANGTDHPVIYAGRTMYVNNFHDYGIYKKDLADGLTCIAEDAEYGVVEAYTSKQGRILGIQWHPERPFRDKDSRKKTKDLIRQFLDGKDPAVP